MPNICSQKQGGWHNLQIADELTKGVNTEKRTLQTDGTSKKGYGHVTCDVVKDDGQALCCGLRDIPSGDAETQLRIIKQIFQDCIKLLEGAGNNSTARIVTSMKNLMSDRCAVQKKFNTLFKEYREEVIPVAVDRWVDLSEAEKRKIKNTNEFFVGCNFW